MKKFFDWMARIVASVILIPAFYFKLSGAESSIATFTALDAEPFGRYVVGFFELGVVFLLLIPQTSWLGAMIATVIMVGAIGSHISILGFQGEMGISFLLAFVVLICCLTELVASKDRNPIFTRMFANKA
ncbi:DoxX family membrane protein [Leptospira borgpetersenii]|uniref:DoxX-like family protein n=1 Tax=Leptospira borgpetersenii serovar Pomona str. 200901868 TaxID=1192866 RepID=M6WA31_LEPBO|nr:DoxX family membrane protein [Leptospira borgpetersenii]EMO62054.1 DoxX-like family protein [Leptospira borgpetersenii serovar Pomona str. 200901868]MBE8364678.1 DoxX-like family protein [Leptospira borgpetersenii serovar Balcanica]MBE8366196.1 DoxX-like family protein [Leptospira borgpetersenii serovar Balcanica]MBE8398931.1 DoxX-like family protein [Leptospira borgpetersenii serovar Tarassovi]MBE8401850.1 DoxX-like family protein [Leptospira borgpetersenii serovar Tarassovi]